MNLKLKAALLAAAVALAAVAPSRAQVQAPNVTVSWLPLGKIAAGMSVSTSAGSATALPGGGDTVYVSNSGTVDAFVAIGGSSVAASATGNGSTLVKAGTCANINRRASNGAINGYISAVTSSSTTTLAVETGIGSASCSGGGGGGSGGGGAVYGPTAVGSPAANPPVLIGGTVDGGASSNISVWKVLAGVGFINCANCSGSGVSAQDASAFTAGTSLLAPGGGFFQTTATNNALTNGQQGMVQMTAQRAFFVNLRNSSGSEVGVSGAELFVGGRGTAGSAAGGVLTVQGVASMTPVQVSQATASNLNATVVGSGSAGSAAAGVVTVQGIASMTPVQVSQATAANLNATVVGLGTAGSASGGVLTVQGVASMTPLFVSSSTAPVSTMNSASANSGLNAALAGVFDDTSPTAITENSFGFLRMSANRNLYGTIRDAAGNERGANVTANNALQADLTSIAGTTTLTGNGTAGAGAQRVTIASDNTAFSVNATVSQATSSNLKAQVDPLTAASWGIGTSTQNSASVANGHLVLGQFNTTPTTITSGNMSPFQLDNAGNLLVNVKAGGGSGGTSSNFGSAFPTPGTAAGFTDGTNMAAARVGAVSNVAAATNYLDTLAVCQYNATPVTITDTRYNSCQIDVNGYLAVNVKNTLAALTPGDGITTGTYASGSPVLGASLLWNGTTYDRLKSAGATGVAAVGGAGAAGAAVSGNPVLVGGSDGTNARTISTDTSGRPAVVGSAAEGAAPAGAPVNIGAKTSGATGGLMQGLIQCDSTAIYDASTSGSTELVALTSGRTIYVCGYSVIAGGTVNVKLVYGTGTNCGTGSTNMLPAFQLTAQAGISDGSPFYRGLKTASANALCINASGAVAAQAIVYYAKL